MGYVWMTLDHRNASKIRWGRILSMTDIIEVLWTRISLIEMDFQGSGKLVLNTLPRGTLNLPRPSALAERHFEFAETLRAPAERHFEFAETLHTPAERHFEFAETLHAPAERHFEFADTIRAPERAVRRSE